MYLYELLFKTYIMYYLISIKSPTCYINEPSYLFSLQYLATWSTDAIHMHNACIIPILMTTNVSARPDMKVTALNAQKKKYLAK